MRVQDLNENQKVNIKELLKPYLKRWYWFVISVSIAILFALIYLKFFAKNVYQVSSSVLIKDAKSTPDIPGGIGVLEGLGSFGGLKTGSIENEMEIFKSRKLMENVVEKLRLPITIYSKDGLIKIELYGDTSPIKIHVVSEKPDVELPMEPIDIKLSGDKIELSSDELKTPISSTFNRVISLPYANIMVMRNPNFNPKKIKNIGPLSFRYSNLEDTRNMYQKAIEVGLLDKDATVIGLGIKAENTDKAKDILEELVNTYNTEAIKDKNLEQIKTNDFLAEKLDTITSELANAELEKERFKTSNQIVDLPTEARIGLESSVNAKRQQIELESQLTLNSMISGYITKQGNGQVLPTNFGINNGDVSANISQYNLLVLERNRLLENATLQNPLVVDLDKRISSIRNAVVQSLRKNREALELALSKSSQTQNEAQGKIVKIPGQEKVFRGIERKLNIKEQLYLLLLQKKEEAEIALSIASNKARIVDDPYVDKKPVEPKKMIIALGAMFAGLLIPFAFIFARDLFDDKIKSKKDIEELSKIPVLGEIPTNARKQGELVQINDNSPKAEAFRILITNLNFTLPKKDFGKIVLVTSSTKGEGKTFVSANLALTLATPNKKVIIIGSDIRNPQFQRFNPERKGLKGLTEFLYDDSTTVKSIIHQSSFNPHLDVIYSGVIPPNPTDLLSNGRYNDLLEELKDKYNYIIIDTAPLMLVSDTLLIADLADATLYVVRSNETERALIEFANNSVESEKIKNVGFVLNDVKKEHFGYGNKYGYGYGSESKGFFQKLADRF